MKVLVIPGLTLPEVSETDIDRIRVAAGAGSEVIVTRQREATKHAGDAEVILGFVPESLFHAAPKLRWVHAIASGVDAFLYPEFVNSKVILTSEKGLVGEHLADHGFGLLLMLTRQLAAADRMGPDSWNHRPELRSEELELTGLTMGIIGFGGTGRAMARRAAAFGMSVRAVDRDPVPLSPEVATVEPVDDLKKLLAGSDVVAVCCPLTVDTSGMLNADTFQHMKPTAFLVNVTRGEVMVEADLITALTSGIIRGAALDVVPREPLPADSELWSLPNVVMTPHTAGASQFRAHRNLERFIANLERLGRQAPLEGIIDKSQGY
ncbi:MAG: D-2-hydroxyacid dehydrogenase [Gammaproteobacteria bacterium]|nr:D-2-hydroxyacid dehydrogenase [Gammaproteobacteria bacterium]